MAPPPSLSIAIAFLGIALYQSLAVNPAKPFPRSSFPIAIAPFFSQGTASSLPQRGYTRLEGREVGFFSALPLFLITCFVNPKNHYRSHPVFPLLFSFLFNAFACPFFSFVIALPPNVTTMERKR